MTNNKPSCAADYHFHHRSSSSSPPMADHHRFGVRVSYLRRLLESIPPQTGGSFALVAYSGNNVRVVAANPSVEEVQARLGYEPNLEPLVMINCVIAHDLQELTNEQVLELVNLLGSILLLVLHERLHRSHMLIFDIYYQSVVTHHL